MFFFVKEHVNRPHKSGMISYNKTEAGESRKESVCLHVERHRETHILCGVRKVT